MHAFESVALSSSPATSFRPSSVLISTGAKTSSVASFRGTGRAVLTREKGHHTFLACVVRLCVNDACRHLWLFGERLDGAVVAPIGLVDFKSVKGVRADSDCFLRAGRRTHARFDFTAGGSSL